MSLLIVSQPLYAASGSRKGGSYKVARLDVQEEEEAEEVPNLKEGKKCRVAAANAGRMHALSPVWIAVGVGVIVVFAWLGGVFKSDPAFSHN